MRETKLHARAGEGALRVGALGLFRLMEAGNLLLHWEKVKVALKMESTGSFLSGRLKMATRVSGAVRKRAQSRLKWKS